MKRILKYFLLFFLVLFLFMPIIQYSTDLFYIRPLHGSFTKKENTQFTWITWFSGEYQQKKEDYKNETFGFRNTLVRLDHQVAFILFKEAKANGVVIGKDNFMYERAYIDAYYGRDFIGYQAVANHINKLREVQDSIQKKGKLLLLVFAPGKGSFYPEYIPDDLKSKQGPRNYEAFILAAKRAGLHFIDFNGHFVDQKKSSPYPLYPQFGIHWSNYGMVHAFDSMCHYIEKQLKVDLPDIKYNGLVSPDTLQEPDDDLIRGMNILYYPHTFKMGYPQYDIVFDSTRHKKLNSVVISDSFWWQIYNSMLHAKTFDQYDFWYYCKEIYPDFFYSPLYIEKTNYFRRLNNADVIIMIFTEPTLAKFGYGFGDLCHETFCQKPDPFKIEMLEIKESMIVNKDWYTHLKEKSVKMNVSLDSVMNLDAIYYYNVKHSKK